MIRRMIRILVPLAVLAAGCPSTSPAPSITAFTAAPTTIHAGEKSTLSWTVTGSTSVSIDSGVTVPSGASSVDVTPTATTTYTLTASGLGGSVTASATVTVLPAVAKPAITAFTASPSTAATGGSVTLSWTVTGQIDAIKVDPGNVNVLADTNVILRRLHRTHAQHRQARNASVRRLRVFEHYAMEHQLIQISCRWFGETRRRASIPRLASGS